MPSDGCASASAALNQDQENQGLQEGRGQVHAVVAKQKARVKDA
jgi:hypothetical protein